MQHGSNASPAPAHPPRQNKQDKAPLPHPDKPDDEMTFDTYCSPPHTYYSSINSIIFSSCIQRYRMRPTSPPIEVSPLIAMHAPTPKENRQDTTTVMKTSTSHYGTDPYSPQHLPHCSVCACNRAVHIPGWTGSHNSPPVNHLTQTRPPLLIVCTTPKTSAVCCRGENPLNNVS